MTTMTNRTADHRPVVALLAPLLLAAGCVHQPAAVGDPVPVSDCAPVIAAAEAAMEQARPVCNLWRDTSKTLAAARQARERGDHAAAAILAQKAQFQAEACIAQARAEKAKF
jgi:hypothetical protein